MDRLDAMEIFARVAELGSFTAAARALRRPRSTLTTTVQALEARLGVKLLHRTTRRVDLTSDGAAYLREVRRLLRELDALEDGLGAEAARPSGRIRVDVPSTAGRHLITPALPAFFAAYPDVVVELGSTDRPVDLRAEGVDCVIRGGDVHDESLAARALGRYRVVTCAAPAYLAAHGVPTCVEALDQHVFVAFFSPRTGRVFDPEFTVDGVLREVRVTHRLAVNDADAWIAAALAGLGLVQLPASRGVRAHLAAGRLVEVLPDAPPAPLPMHVLYPRSRRLPARVRVFIDWVVALYATEFT